MNRDESSSFYLFIHFFWVKGSKLNDQVRFKLGDKKKKNVGVALTSNFSRGE